jgi:hypothetical protein
VILYWVKSEGVIDAQSGKKWIKSDESKLLFIFVENLKLSYLGYYKSFVSGDLVLECFCGSYSGLKLVKLDSGNALFFSFENLIFEFLMVENRRKLVVKEKGRRRLLAIELERVAKLEGMP